MDKDPWFKRWFGEDYKRLYPHRDLREADAQVSPLFAALSVTSAWRILDVCCGSGRHLEVMRARGYSACMGLDLSLPLLSDARALGLRVARGDMRRLPYKRGGFDLVTCFFTSFGYFATFEEDVDALAQFVSVLKPGGYLFLDLLNPAPLAKNLVAHDLRTVDGAQVEQRRRLEGPADGPWTVIKEIEIRRAGGAPERFEERVRLYSLERMLSMAGKLSLELATVFGDEGGGMYHPAASPRMSMLFRYLPEPRGQG